MSAHDQPLHAFFERSARRWPDAVAVDVPPGRNRAARQTITYAALAHDSAAIARLLRPFITGESIVAILAGRDSPCVYAAQLAALEVGAAYTCMDPAFPDEQLRDILSDSGAVALLTDASVDARVHSLRFPAPAIVDIAGAARDEDCDPGPLPKPSWLTPRTLAYVIYTSGTTGRPKGVMIEHASVANLVSANLEAFDLKPGDRVGQTSSTAYDSSVEETWLAFASGATLVVVDDETVRLGPDLVAWLRRERINVLCPPPTLLRTTGCSDPADALPDLRLLYVGGEALAEDIAARWGHRRQLVNGYGPTEATVTAIRERIAGAGAIAIGRPVRGVQAWVLDEAGDEMSDGDQGELCLGGAGLARGYRNLPDLTAQKFPIHPRLGRIFRTGDLAHRAPDGRFFYDGRIDSLVKVRGYRIELEAVEARLAECAGVREAACCVQVVGERQSLVAFVVLEDPLARLPVDELRASLERALPPYMVPSRIGVLRIMPTTVGGKLDRTQLPSIDAGADPGRAGHVPPGTALEKTLAAAFQQALNLREPISIHADFFRDLGGDSLGAAIMISLLREDQATAAIATRDLYDTLTVARLAERASSLGQLEAPLSEPREDHAAPSASRVVGATIAQGLWIVFELMIGAPIVYLFAFRAVPWLMRALGIVPMILIAPVLWTLARMALVPVAVMVTRVAKTLLIGRYRPLRAPAWGSFYVRNWIVHRIAGLIPWEMLAGTEFLNMALRSLGARVGQRVHIHRGVDVARGGWDLLNIGDEVTIGRDASIRLVDIERGHVVVGTISLGDRATLDVRTGMGPNSSLAADAMLTPWSSLPEGGHVPAGERWDGISAAPAGHTPPAPSMPDGPTTLHPLVHAVALATSRLFLRSLLALPLALLGIALIIAEGLNTDSALNLVFNGSWTVGGLSLVVAAIVLAVPVTLTLEAFAVKALGATREGVISRWGPAYIRVWLKSSLLEWAATWLSGTLFWPVWLRQAGMRIGAKGEISTLIDTVPDLVDLGPECFLADGIYLAGPRIDRGTVTLGRVQLGARTFIGNHAVIPCGTHLPDDVLLGVCTVADQDRIRPGSSWFGHPPMELPRREIVASDRRLTHDPSLVRYLNRVFWELLRCMLPAGPILVGLGWLAGISAAESRWTPWGLLVVAVPLWTFAAGAALCALVLVLKWGLLGRVRPGTHPLWSCWCSRWDFLYVAWGLYGHALLNSLEGTLWLSWYLRAMGMTLGRRVLLGYGFAQVVDPDMIVIEDEATVSAMFQAHTFEDRVLKIDRVHVGRAATMADGTVPLYGADIGARTHVAAHSVVMKRERLVPGMRYEGAPTRPQGPSAHSAAIPTTTAPPPASR